MLFYCNFFVTSAIKMKLVHWWSGNFLPLTGDTRPHKVHRIPRKTFRRPLRGVMWHPQSREKQVIRKLADPQGHRRLDNHTHQTAERWNITKYTHYTKRQKKKSTSAHQTISTTRGKLRSSRDKGTKAHERCNILFQAFDALSYKIILKDILS